MKTFVAMLVSLFLVTTVYARDRVVINNDLGGRPITYTAKYRAIAKSGASVEIRGLCVSACTLILGIVPRDRVCMTSNARLGFHLARNRSSGAIDTTSTQILVDVYYPPVVRAWIRKHPLRTGVQYMSVRDLKGYYKVCR